MQGLANIFRVIIFCVWTAAIGTPLLVVIYIRYWCARLCDRLGKPELLDRALEANARLACWMAQDLWAGVLLPILRVRVRTRGLQEVDWTKPHVVCSNHASAIDILALARTVPPPFRFVAKRELLSWPIIGWVLRPAGQIIVDRSNHIKSLQSMSEAASRNIPGQVIFFVEGTRSRTGQLQPFKKGAFHFAVGNGLPVLPTAIRGSYQALAKLPWWKLRPGQQIEVVFCTPINPTASPGDHEALNALMTSAREAIAAELGDRDVESRIRNPESSAQANG
jgi:1-acyl-sn-glycerol-3-phosphate acyltransferase